MKQTLLSAFFLVWGLMLYSQNIITIEPSSYQQMFSVDLKETFQIQDPTVTLTNNTDSTLFIQWTRLVIDQPEAWETQVCDPNECYFPVVTSNVDTSLGLNNPVEIPANGSVKVSLYINPNEVEGTGKFALDFNLLGQTDTLIGSADFDIEVTSLVVNTLDLIRQREFRIFPNPTLDYFEISDTEGIDQIVLLNLVGRQVKSFRTYPHSKYYIDNLPNGLYLVSLINDDYGVVRTMRLGKRSPQP